MVPENFTEKPSISCDRYFLADTVLEEVTFGWPRQKADTLFKEQLAVNLQNAFNSVSLPHNSLSFVVIMNLLQYKFFLNLT